MIDAHAHPPAPTLTPADLIEMSEAEFLAAWKRIVGEPPAAMLPRAQMVEILFETWPGLRRALAGPQSAPQLS